MSHTVAELFVETLKSAGVTRVWGLPGDSLNGFTDVLRRDESIRWMHVRHEESAAFAAAAETEMTGQLAVVAGSCGPGNLHFINGLFDAQRSRAHNDANVLVLGAERLPLAHAKRIVRAWFATPFEAGGRHERRVKQLAAIERDEAGLAGLDVPLAEAWGGLKAAAAELTAARRKACKSFAKAVQPHLKALSLAEARITVEVEPLPLGDDPTVPPPPEGGADRVEIQIWGYNDWTTYSSPDGTVTAGENLAGNLNARDPLGLALEGLMASPTHRANTLATDFTHMGSWAGMRPSGWFLFAFCFVGLPS